MKYCFSVCVLLCVLCCCPLYPQAIHISALNAGRAPEITTQLFIYDKDWNVQTGFSAADIRVLENGIPRTVKSFTCAPFTLPPQMSAVLTVDISGSMDFPIDPRWAPDADPDLQRIEMARMAATLWVDTWPDKWECALTAFNSSAYIVRDFTDDKTQLRQGIISLSPVGGTNYDAAFLAKKQGAVPVAARAKHKPVIVWLTDGESQVPYPAADIIRQAKSIGAPVYCICLGMTAPPPLIKIAQETGGFYYDGITTQDELMEAYRRIINTVLDINPCTLTWTTELNCTSKRNVEISLPASGLSASTSYTLVPAQLPHITADPPGVEFGFVAPGATRDTTITIRAEQTPITVTNIIPSTTAIRTENITLPFTLAAGRERAIKVIFAPADSARFYADLVIESNSCHGNIISFSGGFPGIMSSVPTLRLISPNGGEILPVGKTAAITWTGTLPDDTLALEYSTDGGKNWTPITDKATNFSYDWLVPNTPSTTCVMHAIFNPAPNTNAKSDTVLLYHDRSVTAVDFKSNSLLASTDDSGIIKCMDNPDESLKTTGRTYSVRFSPDGQLLVVGSGNNAEIWDRTTGALLHTLPHDLPVYTAEFDPSGRRVLTASGDETAKIWNVQTGTEIFTLEPDPTSGIVACACFDASGNSAYTGHENGTFGIWDVIAGSQESIVDANSDMIYSIDNNPADNTIATGSRDGTVKIWDVATGRPVTTFVAEHTEVRSIAYDPAGRLIAAGCEDGTVKIWDVARRELVLTLIAHGDIVTGVSFAPDGLHLATSGFDSTVKIWDVRYRGVMHDTSDAFWTIAAPIVKAKDIDFGDVYVTTSKDSLVHEFLVNEGISPVQIDSMRITGTGRHAFTSDINIEGFELPVDAHRNVGFRFTPPTVGRYEAKLTVYYHGLSGQYTLRGRGIRPPVEITRKEIDFGRVQIHTNKDTTDIILRNISSTTVTVTAVEITDPNADLFSVQSAVVPYVLQPDGEYSVSLRFSPVAPGAASSRLLIRCENISFPLGIDLFGTGIGQAVVDMGPPAEFSIACHRQSTSQSIQVVNPFTNASVTVTGISIEGVHAAEFSATGGTGLPFDIAPGDLHTIDILCTPVQAGTRQADLVLQAESKFGASLFVRRLHAVKDTLAFELSTDLVQMDGLRDMQEKRDSAGVFNTGTLPLAFAAPQAIGGFEIDSIVPNPIVPGGSGFIYVRYRGAPQGTTERQQFTSVQACGAISVELAASVQQWPSVLAQSTAIDALGFPALLCAGAQRDTTIELRNTGPASIVITSVSLSGAHRSDFSLTLPGDLALGPQESAIVGVRFTPSAPGLREAAIAFTTSVNDSVFALPVTGELSQPALDITDNIDMGTVQTNTPTTAIVSLRNTGNVPITWSTPAADGYFSVLSIAPATALPGETSEVTVLFGGAAEGQYQGTLVFASPCGTGTHVRVRIQAGDVPFVAAAVGTAAGSPGDIITIPLYIDASSPLAERGVQHLATTLYYNASLLVPVEGTPVGTVAGNERSIPLHLPVDGTPGAPALELRFSVALGNDTATRLRLDTVVAVGGSNVRTAHTDGIFTLTGICREGGIRLFDGASTAGISPPVPSPAREEARIVYSIIEAGHTSMAIVDMLGRVAATLFEGAVMPGVYELSIPTGSLHAGTWFIVMRTPTQAFTQRLYIAR